MSPLPKGIVVLVDGGCRNNQHADQRVAYGSVAVFIDGKRQAMTYRDQDGSTKKTQQARVDWGAITNNQAEFKTALVGLGYIREFYGRLGKMTPVTVCSDSELVVNTVLGINKKFKVPEIAELARELQTRLEELPMVTFQHIDNGTVKTLLGH